MTEQQSMLTDMVGRLFGEMMASGIPECAPSDSDDPLWRSLEELGLDELFEPESAGGFDGNWQDAFYIFQLAGLHAVPLPIGETLVAKKLLLDAGLSASSGAITLANCEQGRISAGEDSGGTRFSGTLYAVPWGEYASQVLVACQQEDQECLALLPTQAADVVSSYLNDAGEQRSDLRFSNAKVNGSQMLPDAVTRLTQAGALLRCAQISGALEAALDMSLTYVSERVQFGRALIKFQVIQHQMALLAEEAAAARCAAMTACRAADLGDASFEVAASKLRANQAVPRATSIAHQAHGAIGFTQEHGLHRCTQRLWSWRSEFGNDRYWANLLGRRVLSEGAENFWPNLTARGDRNSLAE